MPLFPADRHRRILEYLEADGVVHSRDLERALGVTAMTVWRDLRLLEEQGLLKRMRGGAMSLRGEGEAAFSEKEVRARPHKRRIAAFAVAHLMEPGDILMLDGGTTVAALAEQTLPEKLTILTHSLMVASAMQHNKARPTVYLSGGLLRPESGTLVGREAMSFFGRRHAPKLFMSATGLDAVAGVTDPNPQEIEVKQAMVARAETILLLADASKVGVVSLMQTLPWRRIHRLITTASPDDSLFRTLRKQGVKTNHV
ncbi:MAG: DeoR family transcriptional regulator [Verrucomicrobia bacterium]|jgi:DeoR/GlpR family transcriptional regulator of sugar metabolism|nr:DeoR family transcriptional regulator [Verrucomicrobiota bacterium]